MTARAPSAKDVAEELLPELLRAVRAQLAEPANDPPMAAQRRAKPRTGTLELRGGMWHARLTVFEGGKRKRPRFCLGTTDHEEAQRQLEQLCRKVPREARQEPSAQTFAAWAASWLEQREADGVAMYATEKGLINNYAIPELGASALVAIGPAHIKATLVRAIDAGRAKGTIQHLRGCLYRCFAAAVESGLLKANPVTVVRTPKDRRLKRPKKQRSILRDEEILKLLACPDVDLEIRLMALASRAVGGMRTKDLTAWDWSDIDTVGFTSCVVPRTKTLTPQRLVIPDVLQPSLRAWWREHGEPTSGPVFPVTKGKRKGERREGYVSFAKRLRRALLAAGIDRHELHHETATSLPVDFHSGRRAFRSALQRAGVADSEAMLLGGWEDPRAAARYVMTPDAPLEVPAAALPQWSQVSSPAAPNFERDTGFEPATLSLGIRNDGPDSSKTPANTAGLGDQTPVPGGQDRPRSGPLVPGTIPRWCRAATGPADPELVDLAAWLRERARRGDRQGVRRLAAKIHEKTRGLALAA